MNQTKNSSFVLFFGIILGCLLLLYGAIIFGSSTLFFRDVLFNYYPLITFLKESFWRGDLPLWNPYLFTGTPHMAGLEPPVFYPLAWMFLLLPYKYALVLNLIVHHLLAALGIYLLGQLYQWRWGVRLLSALMFTLGGVMVSMNNLHPLQNTAAWIPLLFWTTHLICTQRKRWPMLLFASFYALQILSGHLEIVYFASLMLMGYVFVFVRQDSVRILMSMALAVVFGVALSALQLLPSLAYNSLSVRQLGISAERAMVWSFHPLLTLMFLLPDNQGNVMEGVSLNVLFGEKEFGNALLFTSSYMGLTVMIGCVLACVLIRTNRIMRPYTLYWLGVAVFSGLLAFGRFTPLYAWLLHIPGMSFFRYPSKFLILVSLAAALLAGFGLEAVLQLKTPWAYFQRTVWSWAAIFLLGLACLWGFSDVLQEKMALQTTLLHDLTPERATLWARTAAKLFQVQLMQQIIFCCLLAACFWLAQRLQSKRKIILPALAFLTAADLLISGINIVWLIEDDIYTVKPPVAEHLARLHADTDPQVRFGQANEIKTIPPDFRPDLDGLLYVLPATFKAHVMEENWGLLYHLKGNYGVWPAHTFVSNIFYILYQEAAKTGNREFRHIYESLQAVKYVSAANPEPKIVEMYQSDKKYKQIAYFPELNSYLFENKTYLPRARFQHQAITVKEETEMTMIFTQPTIADFDYQKHVLLLDGPDLQQARAQVPAQEAPQKRWTPAQIGNESNNRLEITFETNTSGYLVLADQYAPGWKAWVNGVETPIIRANFMQRAVRVGPGKHRVEMRYEAPGFLLGLWISGLAAALWLVLLGFSVSRRQRRAEAESAASLPATA